MLHTELLIVDYAGKIDPAARVIVSILYTCRITLRNLGKDRIRRVEESTTVTSLHRIKWQLSYPFDTVIGNIFFSQIALYIGRYHELKIISFYLPPAKGS